MQTIRAKEISEEFIKSAILNSNEVAIEFSLGKISSEALSLLSKIDHIRTLKFSLVSFENNIVPSFAAFTNLEELTIEDVDCTGIQEGLFCSKNLKTLTFCGLEKITSPPDLSQALSLKSLTMNCCRKLKTIPRYLSSTIERLDLFGCSKIKKCTHLSRKKNLTYLNLAMCSTLQKISKKLPRSLKTLRLSDCPRLNSTIKIRTGAMEIFDKRSTPVKVKISEGAKKNRTQYLVDG